MYMYTFRYAFGEISHCGFLCDEDGSRIQLVLYQSQAREYKNISPFDSFDLPFDLKPPFLGFLKEGGNTGTNSPSRNTDIRVTGGRVTDTSVPSDNAVEVHCYSRYFHMCIYMYMYI